MIQLMVFITLIIIIYLTVAAMTPTTKCPDVAVIASLNIRSCVTTDNWVRLRPSTLYECHSADSPHYTGNTFILCDKVVTTIVIRAT